MRQQKMWCDLCSKETHPNNITCQIQYVKWSIFKKKSAVPEPIMIDCCNECQGKVITAIDNVKKEIVNNKIEDEGVSKDS